MTNEERARELVTKYLGEYLPKEFDDWVDMQNRIAAALDEAEKRGAEPWQKVGEELLEAGKKIAELEEQIENQQITLIELGRRAWEHRCDGRP